MGVLKSVLSVVDFSWFQRGCRVLRCNLGPSKFWKSMSVGRIDKSYNSATKEA